MADNLIYWLWLQDCLGAGAKVKGIIDGYNNAKEFYLAGEEAWKKKKPSVKAFNNMRTKSPEDYAGTVKFCAEHKIKILCPDDEYYPERLFETEKMDNNYSPNDDIRKGSCIYLTGENISNQISWKDEKNVNN